jgi:small subunit ribosomal protein S16
MNAREVGAAEPELAVIEAQRGEAGLAGGREAVHLLEPQLVAVKAQGLLEIVDVEDRERRPKHDRWGANRSSGTRSLSRHANLASAMAVRLRLTRIGGRKNPIWRVVVADQRSKRDGRVIETVGHYNAQTDPSTIVLDEERIRDWLARGARPSSTVRKLLHTQGIR